MYNSKTAQFILFLLLISFPVSTVTSEEITKYKDKSGNISYSNIGNKQKEYEVVETISSKNINSRSESEKINYQLENLFNDKNTETELLTKLKTNRYDLGQLFANYERQLEEAQFELNANTVTLDRCYINPVYDYLVLFCSGLELKQQRLLNELDLISNSLDNIRVQITALDIQIDELQSQNKYEVCKVNEILTGDSFVCSFGSGLRAVKLIGIETPDSTADFLDSEILGKNVLLKFDSNKIDINNNLLAYVFINDTTMLNALLLRQGMAMALSNYEYKYIYEFNEYEKLAKESNTGIWAINE